ncbi:MAG: hypothetical protein HPY61_10510 [Methanotrichaceae archaeon]|nr:hypothetical protein [Methanotrichaceae archaeon]
MLEQIEKQAVDRFPSRSRKEQEQIAVILKKYANGEISLDEAYYELLEDELIPMPQRCGMHAKIEVSPESEGKLKARIKEMLPP